MPLYYYKSMNDTGEILEGTENADSQEEIIQLLREKDFYPINIKKLRGKHLFNIDMFGRIKTKDIAVFCRQFHSMLASGVSIVNSLDILRQEEENKRFKKIISGLYENVQKGNTFSEALKKYPWVFPQLLIYMVVAGETSGSLDVVMSRLAVHYEKQYKIANKIITALVYPITVMIVAFAVVVFMLTVVMPTFLSMFEESGLALPGPTVVIMSISNSLQTRWYVYIAIMVGLSYLVYLFRKSPRGRYMIDQLKLRLPLFRKLNKKIIAARFSRTLSTMLTSGVPLIQSLENVASAIGNSVVEKDLLSISEEITKGVPISVPIRKLGLFPPLLNSMIKIGEESGTLDVLLDKTADYYDGEVETEAQRMLTYLEPIMIIFMGLVIGYVVISMVLPLFDVYQTI